MTAQGAQTLFGLVGAVGLHGAMLGALFLVDPPRPEVEARRDPVQIKLIKRKPPATKPVQPQEIEKPAAPEVKKKPEKKPVVQPVQKKPKPRPKPRAAKPEIAKIEKPKAPDPIEPKQQPDPNPAPQPVRKARKFSVSMEATVSGPGVAVPTAPAGSAWAYGSPEGAEDAPKKLGGSPTGQVDGTGSGPDVPVEAAEVTVLPKLVSSPSMADMRKLYPAQARTDGLEADVSLKILVSAQGEVIRVRLLRPRGDEFDEIAERLLRRFRFQPGTRSGRAVAVWMPWTYKFRLDG